MKNKPQKTIKTESFCWFRNQKKISKRGELALPWEKLIWWIILFLFAFFMLWFYGGLREMMINIGNSLFK